MTLFLKIENQEYGPYSLDQFRELWDSGQIPGVALVSKSQGGPWKDVLSVFGKAHSQSPPSPPPVVHFTPPETTPDFNFRQGESQVEPYRAAAKKFATQARQLDQNHLILPLLFAVTAGISSWFWARLGNAAYLMQWYDYREYIPRLLIDVVAVAYPLICSFLTGWLAFHTARAIRKLSGNGHP